jgi:hypothetical protein
MNWLNRRVAKIAETKTESEMWLVVFSQLATGVLCCVWIAGGIWGHSRNSDHIFRTILIEISVLGAPACLFVAFIMILAIIRKRRIESLHDSAV